jgi:hypothetical protein
VALTHIQRCIIYHCLIPNSVASLFVIFLIMLLSSPLNRLRILIDSKDKAAGGFRTIRRRGVILSRIDPKGGVVSIVRANRTILWIIVEVLSYRIVC